MSGTLSQLDVAEAGVRPPSSRLLREGGMHRVRGIINSAAMRVSVSSPAVAKTSHSGGRLQTRPVVVRHPYRPPTKEAATAI